jgi:hypothetical protein
VTEVRAEDTLAKELAALPAPPVDAALSARVQRRGRSIWRTRPVLRPREAAVPLLLLLAGLFYTAVSVEIMARIFVG